MCRWWSTDKSVHRLWLQGQSVWWILVWIGFVHGVFSINELREEIVIQYIVSIILLYIFKAILKHSCVLGGFKTCPPRKILRYASVETTMRWRDLECYCFLQQSAALECYCFLHQSAAWNIYLVHNSCSLVFRTMAHHTPFHAGLPDEERWCYDMGAPLFNVGVFDPYLRWR